MVFVQYSFRFRIVFVIFHILSVTKWMENKVLTIRGSCFIELLTCACSIYPFGYTQNMVLIPCSFSFPICFFIFHISSVTDWVYFCRPCDLKMHLPELQQLLSPLFEVTRQGSKHVTRITNKGNQARQKTKTLKS